MRDVTIAPTGLDDASFERVVRCVRALYAPYALTLVDGPEEPEGDHVEVVLAGSAADIGATRLDGAGSVIGTGGSCGPNEQGVAFVFVDPHRGDVGQLCVTIAHEIGHALGLDHIRGACDPMTYDLACDVRGFVDRALSCGEGKPRRCRCTGAATQNSHRRLLEILGEPDPNAPTVSFVVPSDGATVRAGEPIRVAAHDDRHLDRVELWIDGRRFGTKSGPEARWTFPFDLSPGEHTLEARAVDGDTNTKAVRVRVVLETRCRSPVDCGPGATCRDGACVRRPRVLSRPATTSERAGRETRDAAAIPRSAATDGERTPRGCSVWVVRRPGPTTRRAGGFRDAVGLAALALTLLGMTRATRCGRTAKDAYQTRRQATYIRRNSSVVSTR